MKLVHYSAEPVTKVGSVPLRQRGADVGEDVVADKPVGFWVTDDDCPDNWREWCLAEGRALDNLRYRQEVVLSPEASILYLRSAADIDAFTKEYRAPLSPRIEYYLIDWKPVVRTYQGIVISPYIWERRLSGGALWYYSWDCASGVIWDARAVARLEFTMYVEQAGAA